jgi:hypothetical protein
VSKGGPSISGNLCLKLDVEDFEKEEGSVHFAFWSSLRFPYMSWT